MTPAVGPILVLLGAAILLPTGRRREALQGAFSVGAGLLTLALLLALQPGDTVHARFLGLEIALVEVTNLRLVFAWAFGIALLLWGVYAWRLKDPVERGAGLIYAGCAFGVLFAGDLLTLFLFWEGMALASTVVVLCGRTRESVASAYRYLLVHILGGVLLFSGIELYAGATGSLAVGALSLDVTGAWLILLGFLVNAAAWPLAAWLPDAYPNASPTGTVLLGTYTTKTAVYVIVAAFAGAKILLLLGAAMAIYAVIYALGTRDYRRLLAYSLVGQVGYMLCAAGAGGDLGVSGAASHAFMHVLYKSLLFMAAGAVFVETGSAIGGRAPGLRRKMPWTFGFAAVGSAAICAVPLTNAYVSKALILDALGASEASWSGLAQGALLVASAAAPLYVGLRFLWLAFSGDEVDEARVRTAKDAPLPQRLAMGGLAFLCVLLGVWTAPLLQLLVIPEDVHVYSAAHVGKQLLLLAIGVAAFFAWRMVSRRVRIPHPDPLPDTDAVYWRGTDLLVRLIKGPLMVLFARLSRMAHDDVPRALAFFARNPAGFARLAFERVRLGATGLVGSTAEIDAAQRRYERTLGRFRRAPPAATWPIGRTVLFGVVLLAIYVLIHVLT